MFGDERISSLSRSEQSRTAWNNWDDEVFFHLDGLLHNNWIVTEPLRTIIMPDNVPIHTPPPSRYLRRHRQFDDLRDQCSGFILKRLLISICSCLLKRIRRPKYSQGRFANFSLNQISFSLHLNIKTTRLLDLSLQETNVHETTCARPCTYMSASTDRSIRCHLWWHPFLER